MKIDFAKSGGLVPAIVQNAETSTVLMLGYMNADAVTETRKSGKVTFFSRSKQRLWTKGETSGNYLIFKEMLQDCDSDAVLIKAMPLGPTCHRGTDSCFGDETHDQSIAFLARLQAVIRERRDAPATDSYTRRLLDSGIAKVAQKVGEESVETVIAALVSDDTRFREEAADLIYHLLVLCESRNVPFGDVIGVLATRHKPQG